jgi:hypothetical protein
LIVSRPVIAIPYYLFLICFDQTAASLPLVDERPVDRQRIGVLVGRTRQSNREHCYGQDRNFTGKSPECRCDQDGISFVSREVPGADKSALFPLPVKPGELRDEPDESGRT